MEEMMKNTPLVCICIPSYNSESTISDTLNSLISQTYKNIIIKVMDNASTDGTADIVRSFIKDHPNIQLHINEKNIGGEANFSRCIQNGEGEFTAIFHADDVYHVEMIEKQVETLNKFDVSAVMTNATYIDSEGNLVGHRLFPTELKGDGPFILNVSDMIKLLVRYGNFFVCPSCMGRTEVYKNNIKEWRGSMFSIAADLDVWLRFAGNGKLALMREELIFYRRSTASYSYNLILNRTEVQPIFKVIDYHIENCRESLSQTDTDYYEFLKFKDEVNVTINHILKETHNRNINLGVFRPVIMKIGFSSKYHFKLYAIGMITSFLVRFKRLPQFLRNVIIKQRCKA